MKYFLLSLTVVFIAFLSCNKTTDNVPDLENMLRNGKWKLVDMSYTYLLFPSGKVAYDTTIHDTLKTCNQDDYLVFGPGFAGTINTGTVKCDFAEPDQVGFRWLTQNNDTTIIFYGASAYGSSTTDTSVHYFSAVPGTVHGSAPVFPSEYTATFKQFSQSSMVLRVINTYSDPGDNKKVDTTFWDYTFVNF